MSLRSEQGAVRSERAQMQRAGKPRVSRGQAGPGSRPRAQQVPRRQAHLVQQYPQMSCTRSGNMSSEPSKEMPERHWE